MTTTRERGRGPWQHLAVDLRFAARAFMRRPLSGLLIVMTLAALMGTATAFFSLYWGARYHAHDVEEIDRVLMAKIPGLAYRDIRPRMRAFTASGFAVSQQFSSEETGSYDLAVGAVSEGWLEAVRPRLVVGQGFSGSAFEADAVKEVIISHRLWKERFGGASDVVGRTLAADRRVTRRIVGVFSPGFVYPVAELRGTDIWVPTPDEQIEPKRGPLGDAFAFAAVAARLAPGRTREEGARELQRLVADFQTRHPEVPVETPFDVDPFAQANFRDEQNSLRQTLVAALALLLVGCANIGAHLLSQALRRRREDALCLAAGAWPGRLIRQACQASALLALTAGLLSLGVAAGWMTLVKRYYLAAAPNPGFMRAGFDAGTWLFAAALVLAVAMLIVLPGALQRVGQGNIHGTLKSSARTHSGGRATLYLRESLLALQVGLAAVLLTGAAVTGAGIGRRLADRGFDASDVVHVRVALEGKAAQQVSFRRRVLAKIESLPGIEAAGLAWREPFSEVGISLTVTDASVLPGPAGKGAQGLVVPVLTGGELHRTLRIPLLQGRLFAPDHDPEKGREVVVDRFFQDQFLGGADPVGRKLVFAGDEAEISTIVGVVGRIKIVPAPDAALVPYANIYVPHRDGNREPAVTFLLRSPRSPGEVIADMRRIIGEVDPERTIVAAGRYALLPFRSVVGEVGRLVANGAFGLLALLLTALGLHSAATALVVSRTNEIGVRLAIGASPPGILGLVLGQGMRPIAVGVFLAGVALAFGNSNETFRQLLLDDEPVRWGWAVLAAAVIALVTGACLLAPAWRASKLSPQAALRYE